MRRLAFLALAWLMSAVAAAADQPLRSRLCPEDLPEGVRLPPQPGCEAAAPKPIPARRGFYDLGGTTVQIGGRVGAEFGARR